MKTLKTMSAAVALAAMLPLATLSPSFAQGGGPGPCTPPGGDAVGAAGPAMNGGQLMAGVGQCQRVGSWDGQRGYNAYSARTSGDRYYGRPDYYGASRDY